LREARWSIKQQGFEMYDTQIVGFLPAGTLFYDFDHGGKVAGEYFLQVEQN